MMKLVCLMFILLNIVTINADDKTYIYDSYEYNEEPLKFRILSKTKAKIGAYDRYFTTEICNGDDYYYSKIRGLLAMGSRDIDEDYGQTLFLVGYCGFAASSDCREL